MNDYEQALCNGLFREGARYLRETAHWYGVSKAIATAKDERRFYCDMEAKYPELQLVWYWTFGCLRVRINIAGEVFHRPTESEYFQVLGQNERFQVDKLEDFAFRFDEMAHAMFPGIRQASSFRACFSQFHDRVYYAVCSPIGNKWLCEECVNRFSLDSPPVAIKMLARTQHEKERAKLTPGMRFDVLERDGFICRGCGDSPLYDSSIKLHIDHIHPIAHGGKTEIDNLQTLCQTCNLGKSDKITNKMRRGAA